MQRLKAVDERKSGRSGEKVRQRIGKKKVNREKASGEKGGGGLRIRECAMRIEMLKRIARLGQEVRGQRRIACSLGV